MNHLSVSEHFPFLSVIVMEFKHFNFGDITCVSTSVRVVYASVPCSVRHLLIETIVIKFIQIVKLLCILKITICMYNSIY